MSIVRNGPSTVSDAISAGEKLGGKTWRGAACGAWRRSRRLWEPQAAPLQADEAGGRFFSGNVHALGAAKFNGSLPYTSKSATPR
jgi:hypothetical protein